MGYTTDFSGKLNISPALPSTLEEFFKKLNKTRRMGRNISPEYGFEGEFYVDGSGSSGQGEDKNIINYNEPSKAQPSLWCGWDVKYSEIRWDGGEKFYNYSDWMYYIINRILKPLGHTVNGIITWSGEETDDIGTLIVVKNELFVVQNAHINDTDEFEFYFKKGKAKKHKNKYTDFVDSLPPIAPKEESSIKLLS